MMNIILSYSLNVEYKKNLNLNMVNYIEFEITFIIVKTIQYIILLYSI